MAVHAHIVIPDLFPPRELASKVCAGLHLPALEKILARAQSESLPVKTLEAWLCSTFGVTDSAIAPVSLLADGIQPQAFYWLRADPVHLHINRDQLILQPVASLTLGEAEALCADLNAHFSSEGLYFDAPHPQRWYLRLVDMPRLTTHDLSEVAGRNVNQCLPQGVDSLRWHGILNEIQMLLFDHQVNQKREVRDELAINSVWLWGGGYATMKLKQPFGHVCTDSALVSAFAAAAEISHASLPNDAAQCLEKGGNDGLLVVCDGLRLALQQGDLGRWRDMLQHLEQNCFHPLLQGLSKGGLEKITLDVLQGDVSIRFELKRHSVWKFWRKRRALYGYSLV